MPLNIKDPHVYRLARELAQKKGESLTEAVRKALEERLEREQRKSTDSALLDRLAQIAERCASRTVLDNRTDEEIIGYDEHGALV